jgi:hypothetical protein
VGFNIKKVKHKEAFVAFIVQHCAMKAPMTRDRYKTRLAKFSEFIEIENGSKSLEDRICVSCNSKLVLIIAFSRINTLTSIAKTWATPISLCLCELPYEPQNAFYQ